MVEAVRHVRRSFEFGRHVPLHKIARRLQLTLQRGLRDRLPFGGSFPATGMTPRALRPTPLFASSQSEPSINEEARTITFLGRSVAMAEPYLPDWNARVAPPDAQLWRMKLHEMTYLEQCADSLFGSLVTDWIARNPPTAPRAWMDSWNSYTVSIRTVVWMQELARRVSRLDPALVAHMETSLAQQLRFLICNLETDIGGNHLIKNIKALIWGSAYFTGGDADRWRRTALELLKTELPVQVPGDGMHFERSPSYHCQVFADLLECRHILRKDPLGGLLDAALHRMAQVTADLTHPDWAVAQFNDAGLTMALKPQACIDAYARIFNTRPSPRHVFAFPTAGVFGLRSARSYLVADCGRIAPDDLPAHGHGDILSFEWSVDGQRIVVDQGVCQYSAGQRRQSARSAASHNTLCLEASDQAEFFGAFRCGRRPDVQVRTWQPRADGFVLEGAHDGFKHLPGSPVHVRRFEASAGEIVIEDRIEGKAPGTAAVGFLLHPGVHAQVEGHQAILRFGRSEVFCSSTQPMCLEDAVWWPDLGHELLTTRLRLTLPAGIREHRTVLRISPKSGAAA